MTVTVRLKPATRKLLDRIARSERVSRSEVVRRSIEAYARDHAAAGSAAPYDALRHVIGKVGGGPADLSERTGARFAELLRTRSGRRK